MKLDKVADNHVIEGGQEVIDALNRTGIINKNPLVLQNYAGWLDGERGYEKMDVVVRKYLGRNLYAAASACARTDLVLRVKLGTTTGDSAEVRLAKAIIADPKKYKKGF